MATDQLSLSPAVEDVGHLRDDVARLGVEPTIDGAIDRLVEVGDGLVIRVADPAVPGLPSGSGTAVAMQHAILPTVAPTPTGAAVGVALERRVWAGPCMVRLGPEAVATAWLSALLVRADWTTLWSVTDPNLRLASAQGWLDGLGSTGDNVTAWSLAAEVPHLGLWAAFAAQLFDGWRSDVAPDRAGGDRCVPRITDRHQLGRGTGSDAGRELCVVTLGPGGVEGPDGPIRHLTLRLRDRWRVAGLGAGVLRPGWPSHWLALDPDPQEPRS